MGAERSSTGDLTNIVTSDAPSAVPSVGSSIGPYRVVRKLGSGGMGVVYEAVHKQIGRQAAIKLLHAQFAVQKDIVSRFLNEARAANLVRHPGIVDIYEFGMTASGNAYIVMEYIDGVSLATRLKQAAAPLGVSALPMFQKMAQALAAAHDKGIVHRDLKPDNVMLIADREAAGGERIKILDFGIAKLSAAALAAGEQDSDEPEAGTQPEFKTRTGAMMGTPAYMAPEQCRGAEQVTDRTDVYSFGLMLYRALTGNQALVGRSDLEYLLLHTSAQPLNLHETYQVDAELSELVHAMLAKEPTQRPAMAEIAPHLGQLASRLLPSGAPVGDGASMSVQSTARIRRDQPAAGAAHAAGSGHAAASAKERTTTLGSSTGHLRPPSPGASRRVIIGSSALAAVLAVGVFAMVHRSSVAPPAAVPKPVQRTDSAAGAEPTTRPSSPPPAPAQAPARVHWEVSSTPQGALVISAESHDVLGVTPWRHERAAAQGPFQIVLRLPSFHDTPVTLDRGRDSVIQLVLSPVAGTPARPGRPAARGKGTKSAPPSPNNLTNADLPVVE